MFVGAEVVIEAPCFLGSQRSRPCPKESCMDESRAHRASYVPKPGVFVARFARFAARFGPASVSALRFLFMSAKVCLQVVASTSVYSAPTASVRKRVSRITWPGVRKTPSAGPCFRGKKKVTGTQKSKEQKLKAQAPFQFLCEPCAPVLGNTTVATRQIPNVLFPWHTWTPLMCCFRTTRGRQEPLA